jgi:hypothetical protein
MKSTNFFYSFATNFPLSMKSPVVIKIKFLPFEYKIYQTKIRLLFQNRLVEILIEAYPIMNKNLSQIFPQEIQIGDHLVDEEIVLIKEMTCSIDHPFHFKFEVAQNCEDLRIWPLESKVPGNGSIPIRCIFKPTQSIFYSLSVKVVQIA